MQDRQLVLAHYAVRTGVVQAAHLREQPFALRRLHEPMIGGGTHQRHMLLDSEIGGPQVACDSNVFEVAAALDLFAQVRDLLRRWWWPCTLPALADRVVSFLDLGEERIEAGWKGVSTPCEGKDSAGLQHARRL